MLGFWQGLSTWFMNGCLLAVSLHSKERNHLAGVSFSFFGHMACGVLVSHQGWNPGHSSGSTEP